MKKLTTGQLAAIEAASSECSTASTEIKEMIEEYDTFVTEWRVRIEESITTYNNKLAEVNEVYEEAAKEAQEYYDERTEAWQDSEKGQVYYEWISELEGVDIDGLDIEIPDTLGEPDFPDWDDTESWLPSDKPGE